MVRDKEIFKKGIGAVEAKGNHTAKRLGVVLLSSFLGACGQVEEPAEEAQQILTAEQGAMIQPLSVSSAPVYWQKNASFCLGTAKGLKKNGTAVVIQTCDGKENQAWTLSGGQYKVFGSKCLDLRDGIRQNGTRLQIWDCDASNINQKWQSPKQQIQWATQKLCADVVDGVETNEQPIQVWACDSANIHQQFSSSKQASSVQPGGGDSKASGSASASSGSFVNGMLQGGKGWPGDINKASTSAQYYGLTLDELIARKGELARELKQHPDVEAAIRKVSQATGVPDGLLAGVAYQESSFIKTARSGNPNPSPGDTVDVGIMQCPLEDFSGNTWQDPTTNINLFVTKYFLPAYKQYKSWGMALRIWNTGEGRQNDLSWQDNNTDSNYIKEILGTHCLGLD